MTGGRAVSIPSRAYSGLRGGPAIAYGYDCAIPNPKPSSRTMSYWLPHDVNSSAPTFGRRNRRPN
jgi:hypothetical protein